MQNDHLCEQDTSSDSKKRRRRNSSQPSPQSSQWNKKPALDIITQTDLEQLTGLPEPSVNLLTEKFLIWLDHLQ